MQLAQCQVRVSIARALRFLALAWMFSLSGLARADTNQWFAAVELGNLDAIRAHASGNLNRRDPNGQTALTIAARAGNLEAARLLLDLGADPNLKEGHPGGAVPISLDDTKSVYIPGGRPPLAVALNWKRHDVATLLMDRGADVNAEDIEGYGLLFNVCDGKLARRLIAAGLDPRKTKSKPSMFDFMGVPVPLGRAAGYLCGDAATVKALLDGGADVNHRGGGNTALHLALRSQAPLETITVLLDAGADLGARNEHDETPLMTAAQQYKSAAILSLLLERGADVKATTKRGESVLDHVREPEAAQKREILLKALGRS